MDDSLYDEFGNYLGPEIQEEEVEEEEEVVGDEEQFQQQARNVYMDQDEGPEADAGGPSGLELMQVDGTCQFDDTWMGKNSELTCALSRHSPESGCSPRGQEILCYCRGSLWTRCRDPDTGRRYT